MKRAKVGKPAVPHWQDDTDDDAQELIDQLFGSAKHGDALIIRRAKLLEWAMGLRWPLCAPAASSTVLGLPTGFLRSLGPEASWRAWVATATEDELAVRERSLQVIQNRAEGLEIARWRR